MRELLEFFKSLPQADVGKTPEDVMIIAGRRVETRG